MRLLLSLAAIGPLSIIGCWSYSAHEADPLREEPPKVERLNQKEPPTVEQLNQTANDPAADRIERSKAIFSLFANHIKPGQGLEAIRAAFTKTDWLRAAHLQEITIVGGWIPIEFSGSDSMFRLYLFPDEKGWSDWVIYFRVSGLSSARGKEEEDVVQFLKGQARPGTMPRMEEFALCFPGDHIERHTRKGKRIMRAP